MDTSTRTAASTTTAAQFVAELHANVDAWYAQKNTPETYEAFSKRNGAIRRRIEAAGNVITTRSPGFHAGHGARNDRYYYWRRTTAPIRLLRRDRRSMGSDQSI